MIMIILPISAVLFLVFISNSDYSGGLYECEDVCAWDNSPQKKRTVPDAGARYGQDKKAAQEE